MKSITGEIDRLKQIYNENPQTTQFARLAEYLLQMNRIPESIEICKSGLNYHPNYPNAHFVLGKCYFKTKDFDAAESEFNKVLLHDPEHVQAHHLQAQIMKERGWSNAYLLWLKRALTVDPLDKLSQSLIDDYSEEEMELEEATELEQETYDTTEQTVVEEKLFDDEYEVTNDEVETEIEDLEQEEVYSTTDVIKEDVEPPSIGDEYDEEKLAEEEVAAENEEDDKRYEYIIDDIFKDEVASDESVETLEEEIESYEEPEEFVEEKDDISEAVSEEVVEEQLQDEEEIVAQIRDKIDQFEDEEKAQQEVSTHFEEKVEDSEEKIEDTYAVKDEIEKEVEEEMPELKTSENDLMEEETIIDEIDQGIVEEPNSEVYEEISTLDRERAAREVFGDDDVLEEPKEEIETKPDFEFITKEPVEKTDVQKGDEVVTEETLQVTETPKEEKTSSSTKDPIVTSTLGEIYAAQGHFTKAIGVYEILLKKNPDNQTFKQKIEELKKKQKEAEQQD